MDGTRLPTLWLPLYSPPVSYGLCQPVQSYCH
jgi:hypothetical protein